MTGFCDDAAIPTWAKAYAAAGVADGIIQGVSTAEGVAFQGDEPITFNEAATVLNRVLAVEDVDLAGWYADREAVPSWAAQAVGNMEAVSVLAAGSFGSAAMGETVTRADAARCFPPQTPCWMESRLASSTGSSELGISGRTNSPPKKCRRFFGGPAGVLAVVFGAVCAKLWNIKIG